MTADLLDERDLALQLHRVLSDIDPARWRDEMATALRHRLAELQRRLARHDQGHHRALAATLEAELPHLEAPPSELKQRWLVFKHRVGPAYTEWASRLREAKVHVPSLRPTNYARSLMHVTSAAAGIAVIELAGSPTLVIAAAAAWFLFAWTCELSRRRSARVNALLMRFFGPVAHAHEAQRVNSATWYATALLGLALTRDPLWCVAGVAVLGVGDPVAALIGRRFGRLKLLHGRSLEGSLAFVASGAAVTFALFSWLHPALPSTTAVAMAIGAAAAGALAELVSLRVDDNLSIPLSAASGAALAALLVG